MRAGFQPARTVVRSSQEDGGECLRALVPGGDPRRRSAPAEETTTTPKPVENGMTISRACEPRIGHWRISRNGPLVQSPRPTPASQVLVSTAGRLVAASGREERHRVPPEGPNRLYIVDDDAGFRRALVRLLRACGYEAEAFPSAEAFLAAAEPEDIPSCLVVDLRMPGLSGLDLQERLLQQGFDLSLVFISGRADVQSGIRAMKGGAID